MAAREPDQTIDGVEQRRAPSLPDNPVSPPRNDYPELVAVERAHYVVARVLAQGGVGRILQARDLRLGRDVAIKELLPQHRDAVRRFEREARITARLQHPAIIHVYEAGVWPGGEPFYAMPMVAGRSLDKVVAERGTLNERLGLLPNVIAIADALAYAHSESVIHRDLKPSNVLLGEYGETVVIDWGLAKDLATPGDPKESMQMHLRAAAQDTISGSVVGTPAYMPPEQARGEIVDQRADVYALGALLYKVLTGGAPYVGESSKEVLELVKAGPPPNVHEREPGAPPDLVAIVAKAMARDPIHRYPSASALAQDLKRFQTGQLVAAHRYTTPELVWRGLKRYRVVVAAAAILVVVAGFSFRKIYIERARAEDRRIAIVVEEARTELIAGHYGIAMAYLLRAGLTGGALGFMRADAMRPFEAEKMRLEGGPLIAVSPDGNHVVTGGSDVVKVWSADGTFEVTLGQYGRLRALTFDPTGTLIATGGEDGITRIWHREGPLVAELARHRGPVNAVGFSRDGKRVVTASGDGTSSVWDLETKSRIATSTCHTGPVVVASFSPDPESTQVLTASEDNSACVWYADSGNFIAQMRGHMGVINAAIWSPDGRRVVTAASDGSARVWTADRGKPVVAPLRHERNSVVAVVAISSDGRFVVSAGEDKVARIWELPRPPATDVVEEASSAAAREVATLVGHTGPIVAVAFSDDENNSLVATAGLDRLAKIWDRKSGRAHKTFEHDAQLAAVAFAAGTKFLVTGSRDGTSRIWDAKIPERIDLESPVHAIAASSDGNIAAGLDDSNVTLIRKGVASTLHEHLGRVYAVAFTPDGRYLLSAGDDRAVVMWDVATGTSRAKLDGGLPGAPATRALTVSPDNTLAAAATGSAVLIFALPEGNLVRTLPYTAVIQAVAFGVDGSIFAGSEDGTLVVWRRDGALLASRKLDPPGSITALALDTDRTRLAVAQLTEVKLFHVDGGRLDPMPTWIDDPSAVRAVAFSADGTRVITGGGDGARIWDLATGKLLGTRDDHNVITGLAMYKDALWTASEDHSIDAWDVRVEDGPISRFEAFVAKHGPWRLDDHDNLIRAHRGQP